MKLSNDSSKAFLAYLDESGTDIHVQQVDPTKFTAIGSAVTIPGAKEGTKIPVSFIKGLR